MGVLSKGAGLNLYVRRKSFPVVDLVRTLSTVGDSPGKLPSRQHYKAHSLNHIFVSLCLYSHRQYPTLEMAPSVKLVYFPLRGRAELIRLILEAKGISYQDETIPSEKWGDKKACKTTVDPTRKWGSYFEYIFLLLNSHAFPIFACVILGWRRDWTILSYCSICGQKSGSRREQ